MRTLMTDPLKDMKDLSTMILFTRELCPDCRTVIIGIYPENTPLDRNSKPIDLPEYTVCDCGIKV